MPKTVVNYSCLKFGLLRNLVNHSYFASFDIGPTLVTTLVMSSLRFFPMTGEDRQLVPNEPVEAQDYRKTTDRLRGIHRTYPSLIKRNRRMSTCNRSDLQTLGSQPVVLPQKSPQSPDSFFPKRKKDT